jgi:NitT/TauT family transport system ATP-binding protein
MNGTTDERALRVEALAKTFGSKAPVTVFENFSLDVRAGEFLSIVGPSGCGKSTLLQVVAGLIPATGGRVQLGGRDVTGEPAHMVYLFQQYAKSLLPWMTAEDNVVFGFNHVLQLGRREARERAREHLALVGLEESATAYPWQLSGGMQQRVAIARALSADPKVLLMDEPFSSVDALTRMELHALISELWERKRFTTILVTHDVDEAIFLSDRIALLTRRPATIAELIETGLARPRRAVETHEDPRFLALRHSLLEGLLQRPGEANAAVR